MSHSDTVTQWLFQKLIVLDRSKVDSLGAFQPSFVTIHISPEVLHLYCPSYLCHTVTQWLFKNPQGVDWNKSCGKEGKSTKWCILQGCPDQAKQEEVNSQRCQWWFRLWWHCRFWWLINVCKLYKCKIIIILILYLLISSYQLPPSLHIIMSSHYHIATDQKITWGTLSQKNPENVTVWHGSSME